MRQKMQEAIIKAKIFEGLHQLGIKGAIVSVDRLKDIESDISTLLSSGEINLEVNKDIPQYQYSYEKIIRGKKYRYDSNNDPIGAKSVLILAVPMPVHQVGFTINGNTVNVLIPSDFMQRKASKELDEYLKNTLNMFGHKAIKAKLPLKLLAVRSGLAEYGRNNISYVEGMGSRLFLTAYYIDCQLPEDTWREPVRMKMCDTCRACMNNCPTKAIIDNKRVILAERCLVLYNEFEDDIPSWINKEYHNALIGCVKCEEKCPMNLIYKNQLVTLPAFSEEQTKEILQTKNADDLSPKTYQMIHDYEINEYYNVFHRNLSLLVKED
jgi:epoxyqueuosine reductase